jgi:hypothetical protein
MFKEEATPAMPAARDGVIPSPDFSRLFADLEEDACAAYWDAREELAAMGAAVLEPAIAAWSTFGPMARETVAELLCKAGVRDARVLSRLTSALDAGLAAPSVNRALRDAMWALSAYADPAAAPQVARALDRFLDEGSCELERDVLVPFGGRWMAHEAITLLARMGSCPSPDQVQRFAVVDPANFTAASGAPARQVN